MSEFETKDEILVAVGALCSDFVERVVALKMTDRDVVAECTPFLIGASLTAKMLGRIRLAKAIGCLAIVVAKMGPGIVLQFDREHRGLPKKSNTGRGRKGPTVSDVGHA